MKRISFIAVALIVIILVGMALPAIIPGCSCGYPASNCQGCGLIGNALGDFSGFCFAMGAMGFVLIVWFGIPLAILIFIVAGIIGFFRKN